MRGLLLATMFLSAACLAGCHDHDSSDSITRYMSLHGQSVAVHAPGRPDADISATGELTIVGKTVAVTNEQRDLLKHYYATALAIRNHGIATGRAGAATGITAMRSVASNLANGTPNKIDSDVDASVAKVEASVALICNDLADIHTTQETLAAKLQAFRPYALIKADEADKCRGDVRVRR